MRDNILWHDWKDDPDIKVFSILPEGEIGVAMAPTTDGLLVSCKSGKVFFIDLEGKVYEESSLTEKAD